MQRAKRDRARVRLAARDGDPAAAAAAFSVTIAGLRQHSTPCHLAHLLPDHAEHLLRMKDDEAAVGEAGGIADRLGCHPLLDRAADLPAPDRGSRPRW
jgi:hypothetical protein